LDVSIWWQVCIQCSSYWRIQWCSMLRLRGCNGLRIMEEANKRLV
jgi:hypothetical protein